MAKSQRNSLISLRLSSLRIIVYPGVDNPCKHLSHFSISQIGKINIAAGADGLLIDMHPNPREALCDADQALLPEELASLTNASKAVAQAIGRSV